MGQQERQEHSFIGQIGHAVEPVFRPQGFNWKLDVGLLAGVGAKEIVASTMGVLYSNDDSFKDDNSFSSEGGKYVKLHKQITQDVANLHGVSYNEAEPIATLTFSTSLASPPSLPSRAKRAVGVGLCLLLDTQRSSLGSSVPSFSKSECCS